MLNLPRPAPLVAGLCLLLVMIPDARAQEHDAPKLEVGAHFTSLELTLPGFEGTTTKPGVGGRFAYNVTDYLGLEGEVNFLPQRTFFGRNVQGQFGVKVGKRFRRVGVFAKARPGFVSFSDVPTVVGTQTITVPGGPTFTNLLFENRRETHFSADLGGVIEFYPSRRLLVRVDAGDTLIRYRRDPLPPNAGIFGPGFPEGVAHNFQLTTGVAYRFLNPDGADESDPPAPDGDTPRFEAGVQYTSLLFNQRVQFFDLPPSADTRRVTAEPAVGGRLTVNLNDHLALEGAVDFLAREQFTSLTFGGIGIQGQFGVKAGRRFERFGLFAKARPGFLTFSRAFRLVGTRTVSDPSFEQPLTFGVFEERRMTHFETDLGGVVELYPTRRLVTRFDLGDTIIRYGERDGPGTSFAQLIVRVPAETRHNFQFSAGLGLRF